MDKRDALYSLLDGSKPQDYIPAGFFLHFDPQYHTGQAAVDKHLEFFRQTGMDFVKVQYEHVFPRQEGLQRPQDWAKLPVYGKEFFAEPLKVVEGLVKAAKKDAPILVTLYSPYMVAGQVGREMLDAHLREDPVQVAKGIERIAESLMSFVRGCIDLGVDGFYHSTQGAETNRFGGSGIFETAIKPYDLYLMEEINQRLPFNILHICDYVGTYADLTPFLDYPGHVVNSSLKLANGPISAGEVSRLFGRPFMGGIDRHGPLATGSPEAARQAARAAIEAALQSGPRGFILAADCTVPSTTNWENLRAAIDEAHGYKS